MADSKIFRVPQGLTVELIGVAVENFLRNEKELTVEGISSPDGYLIQAREEATWKKFTGLGKALQVQILPNGNSEVEVNIGMGQWADKVGAAAVGMIFFTPLAVTAAIGAYGQNKLPSEIFECIEKFILTSGHSIRRNVSSERKDTAQVKCPACGATNGAGTKFCSSCGKKLVNVCQNCGTEFQADKKYCPNCGASISFKKTVKCRNCGAVIEPGKKFCGECGTPV